jgi:hypothetical protein
MGIFFSDSINLGVDEEGYLLRGDHLRLYAPHTTSYKIYYTIFVRTNKFHSFNHNLVGTAPPRQPETLTITSSLSPPLIHRPDEAVAAPRAAPNLCITYHHRPRSAAANAGIAGATVGPAHDRGRPHWCTGGRTVAPLCERSRCILIESLWKPDWAKDTIGLAIQIWNKWKKNYARSRLC